MIPKIIHQFWEGERPEPIRQMMISVRKHHPDWDIKIWHGGNVKDLGLDIAHLKDKCVNWASVSNVVRLHAINRHGGFWLDSDVQVLKPLTPLLIHDATAAFQTESDQRLCNAVFSAKPGHPWIRWQIANQERMMNADAANGVYVMTDAPRRGLTIVWTHYYYPFGFENPPKERIPPSSSFTDHHWDGSWTRKT